MNYVSYYFLRAYIGEESDNAEIEGRISSENSPLRQRRAGILKGGRLWKSLDNDKELNEQVIKINLLTYVIFII